MMGSRKLCFLFLVTIFATSEGTYNYGSLYCESNEKLTCHYKPNVLDVKGSVAVGSYNDTLMENGWGILDIASGYGKSVKEQDQDIMYAAGFLEGILTAKHIYQHYQNMKDYFFKSATPELMQDVRNFFAKQDQWLRKNVEANPNDPFWRHAGMIISQFDGLVDGYKSVTGQSQNLDMFAFQVLNGVGDLLDLMKALQPSSIPDWTKMTKVEATEYVQRHGMCSALVKVLGAYENLFMSHSSWFEYQATLRIYKHYNFNVSDPATAAKRISFSSYPGFLESLDDFYLMSSQMVMLQTTNNVFNASLYKFVQPQSLLAWQRIRMANMMAHSGKEWADVVSRCNSGTYNNQYMIIDLKKIQLGQSIGADALWVVEQIPTLVKSGDQSEILRAGYWPSYNVPFYEEVYNLSGYPEFAAKHGTDYTYQLAPRAKIFRRDEGTVVDMESMKSIMRYNDYEHDKYSEGDSCNAICCRGDLKETKPGPFGCYDTKKMYRIKKKSTKVYQKYDTETLEKALSDVKSGMSQRQASKVYGVPQATISDYIRGRTEPGSVPGRPIALPYNAEKTLATKVMKAAEMGVGMTKTQVLTKVGQLVTSMRIRTPFKNGKPGKHWWLNFKRRNPELTIRRPEKLTTVRARAMNPVQTGNYFVDLIQVLKDLDLEDKPYGIWNMDEKKSSLEHTPTHVVASKKSRTIPGRTGNSRDSVTVIVTTNGAGQRLPPLIIVQGKTPKALNGFNTSEGPVGSRWTYQQKAWTENIIGVQWFREIFLNYCGSHRPQLLILDGHISHETVDLLEDARANNIHIMCLPPHTTHYLNPLDRSVFGPLQQYYDQECSDYLCTPSNKLDKRSWPALFASAYNKSVTPSNIISGFRSCGIIPWNPLAIPESAFSPSQPHDVNCSLQDNEHPLMWVIRKVSLQDLATTPNHSETSLEEPWSAGANLYAFEDTNTLPSVAINTDVSISTCETTTVSGSNDIVMPTNDVLCNIEIPGGISGVIDLPFSLECIDDKFADTPGDLPPSAMLWDQEIADIFAVKTNEGCEKPKTKKNTGHRLLTSNEILEKKKKEQEEKLLMKAKKEERKRIRELNKQVKLEKARKNKVLKDLKNSE